MPRDLIWTGVLLLAALAGAGGRFVASRLRRHTEGSGAAHGQEPRLSLENPLMVPRPGQVEWDERFRLIFAVSPIGIELFDADGRLVEINHAALATFGVTDPASLAGFNLFADPNVPDGVKERIRRGEQAHFELNFDFERVRTRQLDEISNAGTRSFEVMITPFACAETGVIGGYLAQIQDISDRKRTEVALRESEERLALAVRGADLGLWDWDLRTGQIKTNERWATMLGYEPDELEHDLDALNELVHPDDLDGLREALSNHLDGRTPDYRSEHRLRTKDGGWLWVLDTGKIVERDWDGRPLRLAGTHLDISYRKRVEEAVGPVSEVDGSVSPAPASPVLRPITAESCRSQ